jgi:hypothetical protein
MGAGTRAKHKKPSREVAHCTPNFEYMAVENSGKAAATKLRTNAFAAKALFAA